MKHGEAVEKLVGFVACESVTGEDIFREIKAFIAKCGHDMKLCCSQGYDGACAMAGALKGCQSCLKVEVPQAVYYHCSSHQLDLALSKACCVPEIHWMISSMKALGVFFKYSPKRQRRLESCVEHVNEERRVQKKSEITKKKFKLQCETRWVERHTAMEDFHSLYEPLVMCLSQISHPPCGAAKDQVKWDTKSTTEADGLLKDIQSSEFLIAFYICRYFFRYTKDISKQLQGASKDVLSAYEDISDAISCINVARGDGEARSGTILQEANAASELSGQQITLPRCCTAQTCRSNHPADSPEEFWRRSVYIPFADHLVSELKSRFNQLSTTAISGLCLLPGSAVMPNGIHHCWRSFPLTSLQLTPLNKKWRGG